MNYAQRLLLATPYLDDPNFYRAVICITDHNEDGAIGFILNRSISSGMSSIIPGFKPSEFPAFQGGPVATDTLHFLHTYGEVIPDSKALSPHLWWGGDFEFVLKLGAQKGFETHAIRFFVGYSGWALGQLEEEIKEESWVIGPAFHADYFTIPADQLWRRIMRSMGPKYAAMANSPDDPSLN
jgi:putative transcriptional regulator